MKLFIGNVDEQVTEDDLHGLFSKYGTVTSCAVMKQYAFVHMKEDDAARRAIEGLNGFTLHGRTIAVEYSKPRPAHTTKVFVGNIGAGCSSRELRERFEKFGRVVECDVVREYAFVHMEKESDALKAIEHLNGTEIKGKIVCVELSKTNRRDRPTAQTQQIERERERGRDRNRERERGRRGERLDALERRTSNAPSNYPSRDPFAAAVYRSRPEYGSRYSPSLDVRKRPVSPLYGRDRSPLRSSLSSYLSSSERSLTTSSSAAPLYERTRLSPPRASGGLESSYRRLADDSLISRYGLERSFERSLPELSDTRRYSELESYRRTVDHPTDYRRLPESKLDFRRPADDLSDYRLSPNADYRSSAQLSADWRSSARLGVDY
ncbi:RNA-binding protein 14-like [Protopterus annectens]|uniref:RNA-binding protein 14-like n=1 Tax=Protopterus annectens TaxID=7888 RepID=UPI001CFA5C0F|nr:RNA-binding protein 14-like [Protopterus annectens]